VSCVKSGRNVAGVWSIRVAVYKTRVIVHGVVGSGGITAVPRTSLCREDREPTPRQRNVFRHHILFGGEGGKKIE
jgi:hypothetical protein